MGRKDAPVERELPALAAAQSLGQKGEVDPIAGGEDDCVGTRLATVGECHMVVAQAADTRAALKGASGQGPLDAG